MNFIFDHIIQSAFSRPRTVLLAVIAILLFGNILASVLSGLGDAEALYFYYSQNLSLSYLDHPPLIGVLIRGFTEMLGISTIAVRTVPMLMTALCLIFSYLCTRDMFGASAGAICILLMFSSPVFSIGTVAASPDSPLAALTMLFTWILYRVSTTSVNLNTKNNIYIIILGLVLGAAFLSKYTGACLVFSVLIWLLHKENRNLFKQPFLYIGALLAVLCSLPVFLWNVQHDWVGVLHRLVYTQEEAGFSLRNLGALVGGQLLYVGPLVILIFAISIKNLNSSSENIAAKKLLLTISFPILGMTYLLVCWSKTAEPHWPAAGYLPLFPLAAGEIVNSGDKLRKLFRATLGLGIAIYLIAHIVVLTPLLPALLPPSLYEPKYDLANELRGWDTVAEAVRRINSNNKPVVAAFYTQCAQLAFHLRRQNDPEVHCVSSSLTDFDLIQGRFVLEEKGAVFVTDNRFSHKPQEIFFDAEVFLRITVRISRAGKEARRFDLYTISPKTNHTERF